MIADAVMAPKRPERDEMLEHDASEETAEKWKRKSIDLADEANCRLSLS
jgi:hypothetical protein